MAFSFKASITILHSQVPNTDQTNFPVLVNGTYAGAGGIPDLRSVGNGGKVQNSNGYDIYFYSDSALTTRIPAERERYNATTGEIVMWVKKTILTASDVTIYIAYGDATISTDPNLDGTFGKTSVWDVNYKGVWHLPDGTTLTANDSTGVNNGTLINAPTAGVGKIDGAGNFVAASSQGIDAGLNSSLNITGDITMEGWVNPSTTTTQFYLSRLTTGGNGYLMFLNTGGGVPHFGVFMDVQNAAVESFALAQPTIATNTWTHIVGRITSGTMAIFLNGVSVSISDSARQGIASIGSNTTTDLFLGRDSRSATAFSNGLLDEFRVSNIARSADWIKTEYNNQSSPSTFYTMGSQVTVAPPSSMTGVLSITGISSITF